MARNGTVKALPLHVTELGLLPSIMYDAQAVPGMILEYRAWTKYRTWTKS